MEKYFNIQFEFDHNTLENKIIETSKMDKGYCCFIDSNVMVGANKSSGIELLEILNNSIVNSCDGSYIAKMASGIYKKKFKAYNGPKFFNKFIYFPDNQCIIGNTEKVFKKIKNKVDKSRDTSNLHYVNLPFVTLEEFNYVEIAKEVNVKKPRYIWVSLGAPKQEIFMSKLLPHLDGGVMLGVGAALNYFSGEINDIPQWAIKFNLIWFFRIITEPRKQISRVLTITKYYPKIYFSERRKLKL